MVRERSKKISAKDWEELKEIAFSIIRMCLTDRVLSKVNTKTMMRGLWEKLEKMYMD